MSDGLGFCTSRMSSSGSAARAVALNEISPNTMNLGLSIRRSMTMSISSGMRIENVISSPFDRVTRGS